MSVYFELFDFLLDNRAQASEDWYCVRAGSGLARGGSTDRQRREVGSESQTPHTSIPL
jgi:hypothetical protein